jgi:MFS transporter, DHA1 family, tetracycline resistance protein
MEQSDIEKRGGVSPLLLIFITVLIDLIGFGMVVPLLPFYAHDIAPHYSEQTVNLLIGIIIGAYSFAQFFFTPLLGRLSDRVGRRPVLLFSVICTALAFLCLGFAKTLWMLLAARLFDGATGGNISTAQAYIADITTPENRAKGMGLIGAGFGLGFILGPGLGALLSGRYGMSVPFFFAAGLALTNSILIYFFLPESLKDKRETSLNLGDHFREIGKSLGNPVLRNPVMILFIGTLAFGIFQPLFPLFAKVQYGYDQSNVGYLFVFSGVIGVIIQGGLIGRLTKKTSEATLLMGGQVMLIMGYLILPFTAPLLPLLGILGMLSVGTGLTSSLLPTLVSKRAASNEQGSVLGITQAAGSLARSIGPVLGGLMIAYTGRLTPFIVCGVLTVLALGLSATRLK